MRGGAKLRSSLRALFGAWAGDRTEPLPELPANLPQDAKPVVQQAVAMLVNYQGIAYARTYLRRLRRFANRADVDVEMFLTIAANLAARMAYQDPVRIAQLILEQRDAAPDRRLVKLRIDDLIEPLPELIADALMLAVTRAGWERCLITLDYRPHSIGGRGRLHFEASLRHWRALGRSARRERGWCERWLHMIDRALAKQPSSAPAIVATATLIKGYGEPYRQGLADWHLIINTLAKPTFDGHIDLPDLADAIEEARAAIAADPRQRRLKTTISGIIARSTRHAA